MLRALAARPLLVRPLRPLLARLPLATAQSRMPKSSAFDLSRPIMGPRPKRPWKRYGFTMDVDYPAVTALLKERDAAQPEARRTGDYSVVDALREYARRWQTWPPRPVAASARSLSTPPPPERAPETQHTRLSHPKPRRLLHYRRLANEHYVSLRDDQRFWCVEPGPPPWFGADGKPRIFAMRHQTMQARAIVQREELERRRLREVENDGYFWTPGDK